jgi:hypothetical protein
MEKQKNTTKIKWPYWLKGGIIFIVINLVFLFAAMTIHDLFGAIVLFISWPLTLTFNYFPNISSFFAVVLYYFFVGSVIGMIYEKIREKI